MKVKLLSLLIVPFLLLGISSVLINASPSEFTVLAQGDFDPCNDAPGSDFCKDKNEADEDSITDLIVLFIQALSGLIGFVALLYIIMGAIRLQTSGGNPESVKSAKSSIINAIIGLVIAASAWAISTFVIDKVF